MPLHKCGQLEGKGFSSAGGENSKQGSAIDSGLCSPLLEILPIEEAEGVVSEEMLKL